METPFKIGDSVLVLKLKRKGIIVAVQKNNVFRVALGSMEMNCQAAELAHCQKIVAPKNQGSSHLPRSLSKSKAPTTIDLHGYNAERAKEAVLGFISSAIMAQHKEVIIIHGHGTGVLKNMVHSVLRSLEAVASFRHPINDVAVTKVYLF